jgi:hypothetical protein
VADLRWEGKFRSATRHQQLASQVSQVSQVLDGREREPREDGVDLYNPRQVQVDRAGLLRDRLRRDVDGPKSGRQVNSNRKR